MAWAREEQVENNRRTTRYRFSHQVVVFKSRQLELAPDAEGKAGAGDGTRTRYLNLGKVALCQVSYSRSKNSILGSGGYGAFCAKSTFGQRADKVRFAQNVRLAAR
jgi:hypothetical protein